MYLYQVGGVSALVALKACGLLCSPGHARKLSHDGCIHVGDGPSIDVPKLAWANLAKAPIALHHNEIAIAPHLVMGKDNVIEGLCECAPKVKFNGVDDLERVLDNISKLCKPCAWRSKMFPTCHSNKH